MKKTPDVTLCVMSYNRARDIENIAKTFLRQDYENSELVIVDDGSTDDTRTRLRKWTKKDKRIRLIFYQTNVGLTENFARAFMNCKGKYIVFLGDDDVFVDTHALSRYVEVFKKYQAGVVRARQVLFRNGKLFQAAKINESKDVIVYKKGNIGFKDFVYETTSIAGMGYVNSPRLRSLITTSQSMYPQVELAAKMMLFYDSVQINDYLIGVRSNPSGLNVVSYSLKGFKTNILDDMYNLFLRVKKVAKKNHIKIISARQFVIPMVDFMPLFLSYNSLKNGRKNTLEFIVIMKTYSPEIIKRPLFLISLGLIFLPNKFQAFLISVLNYFKLRVTISTSEINKFNNFFKTHNYK